MEVAFGCTECPTCKKMIIIVHGSLWVGAQYLCTCGTAFEFKTVEE